MGALSDLLKPQAPVANPAIPAIPAIPDILQAAESQESQESQTCLLELRAHLLTLAEREGYAPAFVHHLHDEDVAACADLSDDTLRAYLHAHDASLSIASGKVPTGFTVPTECPQCGPVWLSEPLHFLARSCPWCFRRRASKAIPRPPLQELPIHDRRTT